MQIEATMSEFQSVVIIKGNDEALVTQQARELVQKLSDDTSMLELEEYNATEEYNLDNILANLSTPSMLADHRFIHIRKAQTIDKGGWEKIFDFSQLNLNISTLILSLDSGSIPQAVNSKISKTASVIDLKLDNAKLKSNFIHKELKHFGLNLEPSAIRYLEQNIVDNLGNLDSILGILSNTYGHQNTITLHQLELFLTESGASQPWKLTDAINSGKTADALRELYSLTGFSKMAPIAVIGTLFKNYELMLKVHDLKISNDEQAKSAVDGVHPFVIKKAASTSKNIGQKGIFRSISLLADAELQLRGTTGLEEIPVLEILIGRLAQIARGIA